jgi:hypothetical protein
LTKAVELVPGKSSPTTSPRGAPGGDGSGMEGPPAAVRVF